VLLVFGIVAEFFRERMQPTGSTAKSPGGFFPGFSVARTHAGVVNEAAVTIHHLSAPWSVALIY
jgi:hypothetical protein